VHQENSTKKGKGKTGSTHGFTHTFTHTGVLSGVR
jgi:hypothetical protein